MTGMMEFDRTNFSASLLKVFALAQTLAHRAGREAATCQDLFCAITVLAHEVAAKILGVDQVELPESSGIQASDSDWSLESVPLKFSDEVEAILDPLDGTLSEMMAYFPGYPVGTVQLFLALCIEPTEEVGRILRANKFPTRLSEARRILTRRYHENIKAFSPVSAAERILIESRRAAGLRSFLGEKIIGHQEILDRFCSTLRTFWIANSSKPFFVILVCREGDGGEKIAESIRCGFAAAGLQEPDVGQISFASLTGEDGLTVALFGSESSYKGSHTGLIYEETLGSPRGCLVLDAMEAAIPRAVTAFLSYLSGRERDKFCGAHLSVQGRTVVGILTLPDPAFDKLGGGMSDAEISARTLCDVLDRSKLKHIAPLIGKTDAIFRIGGLSPDGLKALISRKLEEAICEPLAEFGGNFDADVDAIFQFLDATASEPLRAESCERRLDDLLRGFLADAFSGTAAVQDVKIAIPPLPFYPYEAENRHKRGDFLKFTSSWEREGDKLFLKISEFSWAHQDSVDFGEFRLERPKKISFSDLVGLDAVVEELREAVAYIKGDPILAQLPPPHTNFLLWGPPGTGKTSLALALGTEADLPVFFVSTAKVMRDDAMERLLSTAQKMAPAIMVFEEFNAIGSADEAYSRHSLNQLLSQMDGGTEKSPLVMIATTNYPEQIEPALLRAGRFGRKIKIDLPSRAAREAFAKRFLAKFNESVAAENLTDVLNRSEGLCMADFKEVLAQALRRARLKGDPLTGARLGMALDHLRAVQQQGRIGF